MMMVVDDMEIMPPRNTQFMLLSPKMHPTPNPAKVMPVMIIRAVTTADDPEFISLRKENSRPMENMSTTMPNSAQKLIFSRLEIEGRYSNFGLARNPARIYPSTTGCFSFLKSRVTMAPSRRIHARSPIRPLVWFSSAEADRVSGLISA